MGEAKNKDYEMETIRVEVSRADVYAEVGKATDYTGTKLLDSDDNARERILASDADLECLGRFWDETVSCCNESLKEMLVSGETSASGDYLGVIEVSKSFDKALTGSVQSALRSYFIVSIIGQWFKFANKGEAQDYFTQGAELMEAAERLLYSRRRPTRPTD